MTFIAENKAIPKVHCFNRFSNLKIQDSCDISWNKNNFSFILYSKIH